MLTRMRLENFKSWRELDIELAPITLLFGTNSSGKSSILQSLLLLERTAMNRDLVGEGLYFGGGEKDYFDLGGYKNVVYNHDENNAIGINIKLKYENIFLSWKFEDDAVRFNVCRYINELAAKLASKELEPLTDCDTILEYLSMDLEDVIAYLGPLREHPKRTYLWTGVVPKIIGARGENTLAALIASSRGHDGDEKILDEVAKWLKKIGLSDQFAVEPIDRDKRFYEIQVKSEQQNIINALVDVGFGVSQVLPVITLLFSVPENSIVLIEQPELHLHPSAQARLADLFLEVAEKRKLQLIIESHSEHLLRRFQRRIAEEDYAFATPHNIKAYFCEPGAEGSKIQAVEVDDYGQIRNWPKNFFGDIGDDLDKMMQAALQRRRRELTSGD